MGKLTRSRERLADSNTVIVNCGLVSKHFELPPCKRTPPHNERDTLALRATNLHHPTTEMSRFRWPLGGNLTTNYMQCRLVEAGYSPTYPPEVIISEGKCRKKS